MPELWPFLAVDDVDAAVDFYARAFDAHETIERVRAPDGSQVAILSAFGQPFAVSSEARTLQTLSPRTAEGTTVRLHLQVDDPDEVQRRAVKCGATEMFPVEDRPYGQRQGRIVDPAGHHWLISRPL